MTTRAQHHPWTWNWSTPRTGRRGRTWIVVPVSLLLALATLGTMLIAPLGAMASDPCNSPDEGLICTIRGQQMMVWIPWIAGPVLCALGALGIATHSRVVRYLAPIGWALGLVGVWVAVMWIAGTYHAV